MRMKRWFDSWAVDAMELRTPEQEQASYWLQASLAGDIDGFIQASREWLAHVEAESDHELPID